MTSRLPIAACVFSAALVPLSASALTAPEVWEEWQEAFRLLGQTVEVANEDYANGVLRLEGIIQRMPIDPEVGRNIRVIDALVLTEQHDSTVRIDIEGGYRVDFGGVSGTDRSDGSLTISFEELDAIAHGAPGEIVYDFDADLVQVNLDELAYNGDPVPVTFSLAATGLRSQTTQTDAIYNGDGAFDALALTLRATDADGGSVALDYGLTDMEFSGSANYADLAGMGAGDPSAIFRSESPTELSTTHGPASFQLVSEGFHGEARVSGRARSGALENSFGQGRALYAAALSGLELNVKVPEFPVPVDLSAEQLAFRLDGPMLADPEPQPFEGALTLDSVTMPEEFWSSVDPGQLLARDPITLALRLSGLAELERDLTDTDIAPTAPPPGNLLALALENLDLAFGGAWLKADGSFVVDPDGRPLFWRLPAASGRLNLEMFGVSDLLQNLMQLGLIDQFYALGAQGLLGVITRPSPKGGGILSSELELGADGSVSANGVRLR